MHPRDSHEMMSIVIGSQGYLRQPGSKVHRNLCTTDQTFFRARPYLRVVGALIDGRFCRNVHDHDISKDFEVTDGSSQSFS